MQRFGERSAETLAANFGTDDTRSRVRHLFSVSLAQAQRPPRPAQNQPPGPRHAEFVICDQSIERLFRRLKAWRRVFTRYDKTDVMFAAFITLALIAEALR